MRAGLAYPAAAAVDALLSLGVPVERYGAKGDGTTDETLAFRRAATVARRTGDPVVLRRGRAYRLARPLFDTWDVTWINQGAAIIGYPLPAMRPEEYTREYDLYVDSVYGSDGFSGLAPGRAKRTLAAAFALLPPGGRLGLARGSRFLEVGTVLGVDNVLVGAYGAGPRPIIDAGYHAPTSGWSNTVGNEWAVAVTTAPGVVYWYPDGSDEARQLFSGTAGSLTEGTYAYSGGTLTVHIGGNPTGLSIVISKETYGIIATGRHGLRFLDLDIRHPGSSCLQTPGCDDVQAQRCRLAYSGADNWNCSTASTGIYARHCSFYRPSRPAGADNFSAHGASSGVLEQNYFEYPGKDFVANSELGTWDYVQNFGREGQFQVYGDGAGGGVHRIIGNVLLGPHALAGSAAYYGLLINAPATATTVHVYNNTVVTKSAATSLRGVLVSGGTVTMRNNLIKGPWQYGLYQAGSPTLSNNYNLVHGATGSNFLTATPGANDLQTDPLLRDIQNDDFRPGAGSPALAAGQAQSGVIDAAWGAPPYIGALAA
jgi:hypothetical protein